jgi:2-polyprenyl-6-methoxyphenol hydroxylase-like FAD-dependent oxidoreductase
MSILICGAGPTGLTLALELARRGIACDIIEKRDRPSQLSRAVGILPGSMAILEPSGVAEQIRKSAITIQRAEFHDHANRVATLRMAQSSDVNKRLFALAQDTTEQLLREAFEDLGGRVRYETPLEVVSQCEDAVSATYSGQAHAYDYLVGCDGVRSFVRQSLGISYDGFEIDGEWSIADVDVESWPGSDSFSIFLLDDGNAVVVVPLEANRMRVISSTPDALAALPVPMTVTNVRRSGAFIISVRIAERYQEGRVVLAGDAAHCHSPAGGRGMNLGIADAADLARRFDEGGLENYTKTRRPAGEQVLAFSERGRGMVMSGNPLKRGLLLGTLRLANRIPALNRLIVGRILDF